MAAANTNWDCWRWNGTKPSTPTTPVTNSRPDRREVIPGAGRRLAFPRGPPAAAGVAGVAGVDRKRKKTKTTTNGRNGWMDATRRAAVAAAVGRTNWTPGPPDTEGLNWLQRPPLGGGGDGAGDARSVRAAAVDFVGGFVVVVVAAAVVVAASA